jgi:enduracididine beta-hydroxylase
VALLGAFSEDCVVPTSLREAARAADKRVAVRQFQLRDNDVAVLADVVADLAATHHTVESAVFQREAALRAAELPRGLRRVLADFRLTEDDAVLVLSGIPVDDDAIGPTPRQWGSKPVPSSTLRQDIAFYLVACLLGEPVAWATQQGGNIMHDVFPIREHAHDQIGWGSGEVLTWHTEDAFHPMRTDYLGLMCLRNPDGVETTVAEVSDVHIDDELREILPQERFRIAPDDSHQPRNGSGSDDRDERATELRRRTYAWVRALTEEPERVAVLFGDLQQPYLRVDPAYMAGLQGQEEQRALDRLVAAVDAVLRGIVLVPGDICFIDNFRAVHGRKSFSARFDGTDRWLRRLNVARDLRRSREFRVSADSRVIY